MYKFYFKLVYIVLFSSCINSQTKQESTKLVGGPCEGCEAIYEYGSKILKPTDTIIGFNTLEPKIKISGVVYKNDGKTPAKDVILYAYHTDDKGVYPTNNTSKGWERRHGYLRGWIKTDSNGSYAFYTSRPASYPNTTIAQHIHITVKEPDKNEYYIADIYFKDDPNLTDNIRNRPQHRGGSGIVSLQNNSKVQEATRNIILGLNIPNY